MYPLSENLLSKTERISSTRRECSSESPGFPVSHKVERVLFLEKNTRETGDFSIIILFKWIFVSRTGTREILITNIFVHNSSFYFTRISLSGLLSNKYFLSCCSIPLLFKNFKLHLINIRLLTVLVFRRRRRDV